MSKFKTGDIVRCLVDFPYGAGIERGQLATISSCDEDGNIDFDNYPRLSGFPFHWCGHSDNFELESLVEANE